jgi:hypothetical protein
MRARALFAATVGSLFLAVAIPAAAKALIAEARTSAGRDWGEAACTSPLRPRRGCGTQGSMWPGAWMTRGPIRSWNSGSRLSSSGPGTSLPTRSNAGSTAAEIVRQGLYPYAKGGPVTYTPPGQRIAEGLPWGGAISAGWYQSSLEFLHYMVDQGLPETNPVIPADRGSPRLPCPPLSRPSGPGSPWRSADWWLCRWRPRGCVATSSPRPGRPAEDPIGSGRRARYLNAGASEHDLLAIMLDDAHRGRPESGAVLGHGHCIHCVGARRP